MSAPESEPTAPAPVPAPDAPAERDTDQPRARLEEALVEVKRVIAGQDEMLERVLVCLVAGVPVVGFDASTWALLLALTVLAQLLGHTLLNRAVGTVGPVVVALVILLEVPAATLIAAWWLGQVPPLAALPAAGLVLAGVALVVTYRPPQPPPVPDA